MNATKFEKVFVKDVYSSIANHAVVNTILQSAFAVLALVSSWLPAAAVVLNASPDIVGRDLPDRA